MAQQSDFFKNIVKNMNDENVNILADGLNSSEFSNYVDTGSYALNALLSGTIYGGAADNKVVALAGEEATGKTFFTLAMVKQWMEDNPTGYVFYFDTESAVTKKMMSSRGIDPARIIIVEPVTIQEMKHKALTILNKYIEAKAKDRPPMAYVLDSLGQLSTTKEVEDSESGAETKDMTRTAQIKAAFRVLRLKLAKAKVPWFITNHVYTMVGSYGNPKEMSGGSGLKYAADQILFLTKSKDRDGDTKPGAVVHGNFIKVTAKKSRLTKENSFVKVKLSYATGLDRYYGLLDIALKGGVVMKEGKKNKFPNGEMAFENAIYNNPEKWFTKEVLDLIDVAAGKIFLYGEGEGSDVDDLIEELEDEYEAA